MPIALLLLSVAACAPLSPAQNPPAPAASGVSIQLDVEEFVLDNGMKILMVERRNVPRVYCALYWKVGAVNERPGITGLSHFFEHMMFKGTKILGTTDWRKDAGHNARIEAIMSDVRGLKLRGIEAMRRGEPLSEEATKAATNIALRDEPRWKDLMKEFEEAKVEQQQITVGEHISRLLDSNGGTKTNASTYYDWTRYFAELPANKVELFFWLESETFLGPVWREFYLEREVVKEERRMRYDSTPTGLIQQAYWAQFWQAHPYSWPVIGWMSDIDQYTVADAQEYYDMFYQPQNGVAIFVGDIDKAEIKELSRRYFGRLRNRGIEIRPVVTQEPRQIAEKRMVAEADAPPSVTIRWHGPSIVHADAPALDLCMMALDGRTGRLHRRLVDEKQLALGVNSGFWALKYGGLTYLTAQPRDPGRLPELEAAMGAILEELQERGITEKELQKVKNQSIARMVREFDTYDGIGDQLGYYEVAGNWRDVFAYLKNVEKVSVEDVKRVARKYLVPSGRNVLVITRLEKKS